MISSVMTTQTSTVILTIPSPPNSTPSRSSPSHLIAHTQRGFLSKLPRSWVPYIELIRLEKPTGAFHVFYPHLYGTIFAACVRGSTIPPSTVVRTCALMLVISFVLRCVGCTWNDIIDVDFDRKVTRCRSRPLARGALPIHKAYWFCAVQLAIWAAITYVAGWSTFVLSLPIIFGAIIYPLCKRFTHYPQVWLGFTLSYGCFIGASALVVSPVHLAVVEPYSAAALCCLFTANIIWCVVFDIVYASQDFKDDQAAGVKSMTQSHKGHTMTLISGLSMVQVIMLGGVGWFMDANIGYYALSCVLTSVLLGTIIGNLDLNDPKKCLLWCKRGGITYGITVAGGLLVEYWTRRFNQPMLT